MPDDQEVVRERCFLYSPDCPEGKLFEGADAITAATEEGWVESPDDVKAPADKKPRAGGRKKAAENESQ